MSRGAGHVQRAILECLNSAMNGGVDFRFTTKDFCRAVYGGFDIITKPQRAAVLRNLRRIKNGPIPSAPGWYAVRIRSGRAWDFLAPQPGYDPEPQPASPRRSDGRLAGALRMLASDVPGERDAAVLAATRLLSARNMTWDDVARAVERLG